MVCIPDLLWHKRLYLISNQCHRPSSSQLIRGNLSRVDWFMEQVRDVALVGGIEKELGTERDYTSG